jgi:protein-S-isoprenylcysteine O-methyltransferase Ste14
MSLKRTRQSRSSSNVVNLAKTLLQVVVFWGFFLWLLPSLILRVEGLLGLPNFKGTPAFGWTLFCLLSVIGLSSGIIFALWGKGTPLPLDTATQLVVRGPYRFVRNPMALAGIGQGISVGIVYGSPWVILYSLSGGVLWHLFARPWEEQDLESRFGEPYVAYRQAVPLWVPRLRPHPVVQEASRLDVETVN